LAVPDAAPAQPLAAHGQDRPPDQGPARPAAQRQDQRPDQDPVEPAAADRLTRRAAAEFVLEPHLVAAVAQDKGVTYVDLQPKANQKLKEQFHNFDANTLAELPQERQTLQGLKFQVGEAAIQLANDKFKDKYPEKVEGIKVEAKFARLH